MFLNEEVRQKVLVTEFSNEQQSDVQTILSSLLSPEDLSSIWKNEQDRHATVLLLINLYRRTYTDFYYKRKFGTRPFVLLPAKNCYYSPSYLQKNQAVCHFFQDHKLTFARVSKIKRVLTKYKVVVTVTGSKQMHRINGDWDLSEPGKLTQWFLGSPVNWSASRAATKSQFAAARHAHCKLSQNYLAKYEAGREVEIRLARGTDNRLTRHIRNEIIAFNEAIPDELKDLRSLRYIAHGTDHSYARMYSGYSCLPKGDRQVLNDGWRWESDDISSSILSMAHIYFKGRPFISKRHDHKYYLLMAEQTCLRHGFTNNAYSWSVLRPMMKLMATQFSGAKHMTRGQKLMTITWLLESYGFTSGQLSKNNEILRLQKEQGMTYAEATTEYLKTAKQKSREANKKRRERWNAYCAEYHIVDENPVTLKPHLILEMIEADEVLNQAFFCSFTATYSRMETMMNLSTMAYSRSKGYDFQPLHDEINGPRPQLSDLSSYREEARDAAIRFQWFMDDCVDMISSASTKKRVPKNHSNTNLSSVLIPSNFFSSLSEYRLVMSQLVSCLERYVDDVAVIRSYREWFLRWIRSNFEEFGYLERLKPDETP